MTDRMLHAVARIAIRLWPPLEAKRRIDSIGSVFTPITIDEGSRLFRTLRGGTCLSRALAIASRMPGAEVVIGATSTSDSPMSAHAWIEAGGTPIGLDGPRTELARLR
jgi:hypothetical protein